MKQIVLLLDTWLKNKNQKRFLESAENFQKNWCLAELLVQIL